MDEPWTQSSMQSSDTGRGAGKTRQEEMDVEEKRNVNIIVHSYTIIHIFRFFKAKKPERVQTWIWHNFYATSFFNHRFLF